MKKLGDFLAAKWERPYSVVMGWVRECLSFAILRAVVLCVHGSRTRWRSLGLLMVPLCQSLLLNDSFFVFLFCVCVLWCSPVFVLMLLIV